MHRMGRVELTQIGVTFMDKVKHFLDWHETQCYKYMDFFNVSEYEAMWLSFAKGLFLALILVWIF